MTDERPIEVLGKNPLCISFLAPITAQTAPVLVGAISNAVNNSHDEIHLLLSTPGGSVAEGVSIYNLMRALPVDINTYNVGSVNSIGNVVFQAGKRRVSSKTSSFMFHGVGFDIQNSRLELKQLNEKVRTIKNDQSQIAEIIHRHTSIEISKINKMFLEMEHVSAQEAFERGITDEVTDIHLPEGMPIQQLIFQG